MKNVPPGYLPLVSDRHLRCCVTKTKPLISDPFNLLCLRLPLLRDWYLHSPSYPEAQNLTPPSLPLTSKTAACPSAPPSVQPAPALRTLTLGKPSIIFCLDPCSRYLSRHSPASNPPGGPHILRMLTSKLSSVAYRCPQSVGFTLTCKLPTEGSWPGATTKGSCPRELPSRRGGNDRKRLWWVTSSHARR